MARGLVLLPLLSPPQGMAAHDKLTGEGNEEAARRRRAASDDDFDNDGRSSTGGSGMRRSHELRRKPRAKPPPGSAAIVKMLDALSARLPKDADEWLKVRNERRKPVEGRRVTAAPLPFGGTARFEIISLVRHHHDELPSRAQHRASDDTRAHFDSSDDAFDTPPRPPPPGAPCARTRPATALRELRRGLRRALRRDLGYVRAGRADGLRQPALLPLHGLRARGGRRPQLPLPAGPRDRVRVAARDPLDARQGR